MLTVTHRQCGLWHDLHNGRSTSCKAGQIVHRRETIDTSSIVCQLMGYDGAPSSLSQLQWGIQSESVAMASYTKYKGSKVSQSHQGVNTDAITQSLRTSADGL